MQPLLAGEPDRVGDYRILARIGKGSMGGVYLGRSRGGRAVAVKLVRPDLAEDPEFRERFRREAMMARAVGGFWTATVVDADPDADQPWLATEYVPGPTLHQAVADHGPLPEHTVRSLAAGLAEALGAIHRADLVHRDLKPANVLLGPDGPRVIDFGISRAVTSSSMTATGMFFGTPGFFSPEQTLGDEVGPASDVFALGAVLVFAATGHGPFGDEHTAAMLYRVVHTEPRLDDVGETLRPVLADCLHKDPAQRPTPSQLLDRIGETSPQGDQWLPPAITAVITEHATQLQKANAEDETVRTPAPTPSGTRQYTSGIPAASGTAIQPVPPVPVATPPPRQAPIVPAQARPTSQQPRTPLVRKDIPGPVFKQRGKVTALLTGLFAAALIVGMYTFTFRIGGVPDHLRGTFLAGVLLLGASCVLSFLKVLTPALRLKINQDGVLISRLGGTREIPWQQVGQIGIVGRGRKQQLTVWPARGSRMRSTWWHLVRRYHGGSKVFPVGGTGGWWTRRQESKRIRVALSQYAPHAYDTRML